MGISIGIVFLVLFLVFMFSLKNISESAKSVALGVGIILLVILLFNIIRR